MASRLGVDTTRIGNHSAHDSACKVACCRPRPSPPPRQPSTRAAARHVVDAGLSRSICLGSQRRPCGNRCLIPSGRSVAANIGCRRAKLDRRSTDLPPSRDCPADWGRGHSQQACGVESPQRARRGTDGPPLPAWERVNSVEARQPRYIVAGFDPFGRFRLGACGGVKVPSNLVRKVDRDRSSWLAFRIRLSQD